jgi:hypothetical protein
MSRRCAKTQGRILNDKGEIYDPQTMREPTQRFRYYDEDDNDLISLESYKLPERWGSRPGICYFKHPLERSAFRTIDHQSLTHLLQHGDMREPETRGQITTTRLGRGGLSDYDVQMLSPYRPSPPSLLAEQANAGPYLARYGKPMPTGDMIDQIYNHLLYVIDTNNAQAANEPYGGKLGTWFVEPAQSMEKDIAREHRYPEAELNRAYLVMKPVNWKWACDYRFIIAFAYHTARREIDVSIVVYRPENNTIATKRQIPWNSVADYLQSDVLLYLLTKSFESLLHQP